MKLLIFNCLLIAGCVCASASSAQGLFSGNKADSGSKGLFSGWGQKENSGSTNSSLWGSNNSSGKQPFSFGDSAKRNDSGWEWSRPAWLPARDPSQPTMMERWSENSRNFFQNTSSSMADWRTRTGENLRNANQNFKENTARTWDNITSGKPPWKKDESTATRGPQPQLRSANGWMGGGNKLR